MMPPTSPTFYRQRKTAFSLVELMITIGLILVLTFLAASGVNRAITSSRSAKCMGQLKQIYVSLILYSQDYSGRLPPVIDPGTDQYSWNVPWRGVWCSPHYLPEKGFPNYVSGGEIEARKLMICPENLKATPNHHLHSQFRNYYLSNFDLMTSSGFSTPPARLSDIQRRNTVLLLDASVEYWASAGVPASAFGGPAWNRIGANHGNRVNILWADGHFTSVPKYELRRIDFERKSIH